MNMFFNEIDMTVGCLNTKDTITYEWMTEKFDRMI